MLCIGHRGARGHAPENTLASVRMACTLGAHCVEIDVHLVDGELLVIHDDRLERSTNGTGYLKDHSFAELRELDAGQGEQIPTLRELCSVLPGTVGINIELKGPGTAAPVARQIAELREQGWSDNRVLISSFDHEQLAQGRELDPRIKLGILLGAKDSFDPDLAERLGAHAVHPALEGVEQQLVTDAHSHGLKVYVYTVNEADDIERMRKIGVDGVFTDFPELVLDGQADTKGFRGWR
jgi:glycerophosphoryl diester phosphodiesterase